MGLVDAGLATAYGISTEFMDVYATEDQNSKEEVGRIMSFFDSDNAFKIFHMFESMPVVTPWAKGDGRPRSGFGEFRWSQINYNYNLAIEWDEDSEDDDQTDHLVPRANESARRFVQARERALAEMMLATLDTVDPLLSLQGLPKAFDGFDMFSAGSGSRFGLTGGNLLTGSGTATLAAVKRDYARAMRSYALMKDTRNQPYHSASSLKKPLVVYGPELTEVMAEFARSRTVPSSSALNATQIDNVWQGEFDTWLFNRIGGDDWFIFLQNVPYKPFYEQERRALRHQYQTQENSDRARDTRVKAVMFDWRGAWSIGVPMTGLKIDN